MLCSDAEPQCRDKQHIVEGQLGLLFEKHLSMEGRPAVTHFCCAFSQIRCATFQRVQKKHLLMLLTIQSQTTATAEIQVHL